MTIDDLYQKLQILRDTGRGHLQVTFTDLLAASAPDDTRDVEFIYYTDKKLILSDQIGGESIYQEKITTYKPAVRI